MLDLLSIGTNRGHSMIGVGISAGLTGAKRARSIQDPLPALDLDWATDRSLPAAYGPTPSFSRASTGTFFNSSGVLTTAAVNGPRFDHVYDGSSWVSKGLLVEEQRTNNSQYSEDLTNAWWTKYQTSILSNSAAALDGNQTADKLVENSLNDQHSIFNSGFATTAGTAYTISFFAKSAGRNFIQFMSATSLSGASARANFDLQSGVLGTVSGTNTTAEIVNVGNGWYRCVTKISSASATGTAYLQFAMVSSATATAGEAYLGDGSSGVLIWGIQLESGGGFPTSYIPTTTAAVTRSADVCQITGADFSGFWNASEGSYTVEFDRLADHNAGNTNRWTLSFNNGSTSYIDNWAATPGGGSYLDISNVYSVGSQQAAVFVTSSAGGVMAKSATGWKFNDFAASFNGGAVQTDNSFVVPVGINRLNIGMENSAYFLCGHIARLRYYPTRLTNAKLQELST